ncbi:glycosyltransferase family 2 protein [Mycena metata]|uniref:chitin synthase n=1 Tax=Mycena metata TaxID=1033252 RepID=A0AAD7K0W8_9AGAR|nr:glycosyltransferase family 2 protein [Mycena metata]
MQSKFSSVSFQPDVSRILPLDAEADGGSNITRKKSLVRPERERIGPGHRQWHYRSRVAQLEEEEEGEAEFLPMVSHGFRPLPTAQNNLRRGKSILGREPDLELDTRESGLAIFKRAATLRRKRRDLEAVPLNPTAPLKRPGCLGDYVPGPKGPWMLYCYLLTCFIPVSAMKACGLRTPEQQRAWREKIGLVAVILFEMAVVGFFTFGFTEAVCGTPANAFHGTDIGASSVVINGYDYDFSAFKHPATGVFDGNTNPLTTGGWDLGGNDASFLFQTVNENCLGLITKPSNSDIIASGDYLEWYFPCNVRSRYGTNNPNVTGYASSTNCHTSSAARSDLTTMKPQGQVYYTWSDVRNTSRNLAVFELYVLDLELLAWLNTSEVSYPSIFDEMKISGGEYSHRDLTMTLYRQNLRTLGHCLQDIITVGFLDTSTIGCVASEVVLYASLVVIVGVVALRFAMAVIFQWFFSRRIGNFPAETRAEHKRRATEIEEWSDGIYRPAPSSYRPDVGKNGVAKPRSRHSFLPVQSRFTPALPQSYGRLDSTTSLAGHRRRPISASLVAQSMPRNPTPYHVDNVVPQPSLDYEPFNFPLLHTICLVTAYSESEEGLRTTLDSLATTDYPNSHKVILIISDGMVKGAGNELTTPEICLTMMKDSITGTNFNSVQAQSYLAIADGHKQHNMAKVFAGFYDYDESTVEVSKQQRVPMIVVAKCGNPLEAGDAKPGNRGKRDSQMILMAFLQKVMFDERMTTLEYEFFNSLWSITGVSPDRYELVLCVDADTKAFPDSLSRMVACMVHDPEIMGLCGETKVANKADSWVTMIQVFEYYISHHLTKAFESLFGIVTCLPGCFSMYRIKAPKGDNSGYWVPILANPDVVEHYAENVVDTLHKKNLLLLGEDRYLTTLMLKAFPKRKNIFCQQAICKTIVPDSFSVLLSQRRRWINSTVHNLFELVLVRESCGTFCFSMQFMVGVELAGTLVLPAAISFTLYLIISSIIPGGSNNTIPLVLLALILGLPAVLIVITSTKVSYVWWMLVYLISLPIWNGVLPAYAFWHFDDFSWGQTRKVSGDTTHTGDKEGEFNAEHIVMKRWAEFERERLMHVRPNNHRRSSVPQSENFSARSSRGFEGTNLYRDSVGLIKLPDPLSPSPIPPSPSSSINDLRSYTTGNAVTKHLVDYDSAPPHSFLPGASPKGDPLSPGPGPSRFLDSPVPRSNFELNPFRDNQNESENLDLDSYLEESAPPYKPAIRSRQSLDGGPLSTVDVPTSRPKPRTSLSNSIEFTNN